MRRRHLSSVGNFGCLALFAGRSLKRTQAMQLAAIVLRMTRQQGRALAANEDENTESASSQRFGIEERRREK